MSIRRALTRSFLSLVATCSLLCAVAPSQAAVVATFDPPFGPAIPHLGFKGSITLDVAPACYALGAGWHDTDANCAVTAQSAHLDFYNATLDPTGTTVLTTVDLFSTDFVSFYVYGIYIDPLTGQLSGFDTYDSEIFSVTVTDNRDPFALIDYDGSMVLFFQSGMQPLFFRSAAAVAASIPGVGGAYLKNCTDISEGCYADDANVSNPGRLVFTTNDVPEPDGIALALIGLGALTVLRRSRKSAR